MTTTTKEKTQTNGQSKKPATNGQSKPPAKPLPKQEPVDSKVNLVMKRELEFAETFERVNQLKQLCDKRSNLAEKRAELRQFRFGKDDGSAVLTMVDQNNKEFRTVNTNLIEMLTTHLDDLMTGKIDEITEEILEFKI